MSFVIGPGKRVTTSDVARIASQHQKIALEISSDSIKGECSGSEVDSERMPGAEEGSTPCAPAVSRAGTVCRVISLAQAKGIANAATLHNLADLLNCNIAPFFSSVDSAGDELIALLGGKGICINSDGDNIEAPAALAQAGIGASSLLIKEKAAFTGNPFLATGLGCLLVVGAQNLIRVVDGVAALSCEAYGCGTDAFDAAAFEAGRPHRNQMQSASNLRLLLEGSKRVNTCGKEGLLGAGVLHATPQLVGPCLDAVNAAAKTMDIELNSFECGSSTVGVERSQTMLSVHAVCNALESLSDASLRRQAAVRRKAYTEEAAAALRPSIGLVAVSNTGGEISGVEVNFMFEKLQRAAECLALEAATALDVIARIEAEELAAKLSKAQIKEESAPEGGAAEGDKGGKPISQGGKGDKSDLTPEQLAKIEAKRRAKAEKAAQKAAAKEQKRSASSVVLGVGSTQLRSFLLARIASTTASSSSNGDGSDGSGVSVDLLISVLDPLDLSPEGLPAFCVQLLEQLNSGGKYRPKIAKGARDFGPEQMRVREQAFSAIRRVFKRHGGVEIDTPVFELKELLTGKYGEDSKLIYDLADQGGELLSLRYDLTVPFARFLAMNSVGNIKRFHIAKVYRRDQPQPARGRFREFYQCDFDVAGSFAPMVADAEVITVAAEILSELPVGKFVIKLNHRKLLDAIFDLCGVPVEKFRPICSAVDKLDKMSWEEVKAEMVDEKGLAPEIADRIGTFVLHSGEPMLLWQQLTTEGKFSAHEQASAAMADLKLLFDYLSAMGSLPHVSFDLSLARGLDYYTGVIYEAVLIDGSVSVGSIAAGGRYDNLVGMFSPVQTPCVGVSIGVERVFAIMEKKAEQQKLMQATNMQVYVASIGAGLVPERMRIAQTLWKANLSAEYSHLDNPKFKKQLDDALERGIGFMVVFGQDELDKGVLKLKNMAEHTEVEVPREELVAALIAQGCEPITAGSDLRFLEQLRAAEPSA